MQNNGIPYLPVSHKYWIDETLCKSQISPNVIITRPHNSSGVFLFFFTVFNLCWTHDWSWLAYNATNSHQLLAWFLPNLFFMAPWLVLSLWFFNQCYHSMLDIPLHLFFHCEQCCLVLPNPLSPFLSRWLRSSLSCSSKIISNHSIAAFNQCRWMSLYPAHLTVTREHSGLFCPPSSSSHCTLPISKYGRSYNKVLS